MAWYLYFVVIKPGCAHIKTLFSSSPRAKAMLAEMWGPAYQPAQLFCLPPHPIRKQAAHGRAPAGSAAVKDQKTSGPREKGASEPGPSAALGAEHRGMQVAPAALIPAAPPPTATVVSISHWGRHSPLRERHSPSQHVVSSHLNRD